MKRFDPLTLLFTRIVCSLFWFIPTVWIAYRQLHIEQEKSCDECAVAEGIEAVCPPLIKRCTVCQRARSFDGNIYFKGEKENA